MSSCVFLHLAILTEPGWLFPPSFSLHANYHHEPTSSYILDTQTEEWCQSFCLTLSKMEGDEKIDTNLIYVSSVEVLRKCSLVTSANHPISLSTKCWLLKTHLEKQITGQSSLAVTDRNNGSLFIHSMTPNAHLLLQQSSFNSVTWASQISPAL